MSETEPQTRKVAVEYRIAHRAPSSEGPHPMSHNLSTRCRNLRCLREDGKFYSLPLWKKRFGAKISRLPVSIRIVLESVLRNCDGKKVTEEHVRQPLELEAELAAHRGNSFRAVAHPVAGPDRHPHSLTSPR